MTPIRFRCLLLCAVLLCVTLCVAVPARAGAALQPAQLAIVINDAEPNSVAIGEYYRMRRAIPAANVIHVHLAGAPREISADRFALLKAQIDRKLGPEVQAVLFIWTAPYKVECNALTGAYTLGVDRDLCARTCAPGRPSPYFNARTARPYTELRLRLSMLLPTESVTAARALIDRGAVAGLRRVAAGAYFLTTSEAPRNSRAQFFPPAGRIAARQLTTHTPHADLLENVHDILVYETGMAAVAGLDTLDFVPGALADHLTSLGGDLLGTEQMSSLRWLEAGATASYGTVSEPCNHWQKFPNPTVLLRHYLSGDSAIEAYWKSVAWPTQGLFIGEPLAAPYASVPR